jgi:putative PIN family toxin of toxin-antitoxin system
LVEAVAFGQIAMSRPVHTEIVEVLNRPKFAKAITSSRRAEVLAMIESTSVWFDPAYRVEDCRDPKDNKYLELAAEADADGILSGDQDLTVLNPWRGIPILGPADFLAWMGSPHDFLKTAR